MSKKKKANRNMKRPGADSANPTANEHVNEIEDVEVDQLPVIPVITEEECIAAAHAKAKADTLAAMAQFQDDLAKGFTLRYALHELNQTLKAIEEGLEVLTQVCSAYP